MTLQKSLIGISAALLLTASCTTTPKDYGRTPSSSYVDPAYNDTIRWINEALAIRSEALRFAQAKGLDKDTSQVPNVTHDEGVRIRKMMDRYLELRRHLLAPAIINAKNFSIQSNVEITTKNPTKITSKEIFLGIKKQSLYRSVKVNPLDQQGEKFIFQTQLAVASALILMDNYLVAVRPFHENETMRYALNFDVGKSRALKEMTDEFNSIEVRQELERAVKFVDEVMNWRRRNGIQTNPEETSIYEIIQSSIWYVGIRNGQQSNAVVDKVKSKFDSVSLYADKGGKAITNSVSMGFGNLVGTVSTRRGYLDSMSRDEQLQLISEMKPLDVIMEKTPFRLTDKLIPGHYGHVAIWVGTETQLKELGAWDHIPKHIQNMIRNGHHIVEALRPGVQINTLKHFLNIDDLLVIRDIRPNITDSYRRDAILKAIAQIGKEYDFNFDVNTHEKIVCSELAYVVFGDIIWPLDKTLGRYTISPDNVVKLAVGTDRVFEPIILYYDGQRYNEHLDRSVELLLQANDASYAEFRKLQRIKK